MDGIKIDGEAVLETTATDFRNSWGQNIQHVRDLGPLIITRQGRPYAAMVAVYEADGATHLDPRAFAESPADSRTLATEEDR